MPEWQLYRRTARGCSDVLLDYFLRILRGLHEARAGAFTRLTVLLVFVRRGIALTGVGELVFGFHKIAVFAENRSAGGVGRGLRFHPFCKHLISFVCGCKVFSN